jgi:hypothetical protein
MNWSIATASELARSSWGSFLRSDMTIGSTKHAFGVPLGIDYSSFPDLTNGHSILPVCLRIDVKRTQSTLTLVA